MKTIRALKFTGLASFIIMIWSCEDIIHPKLESADPVIVVDAWLNNKSEIQKILITKTQPYFENRNPYGVSDAVVSVVDNDGKVFSFMENPQQAGSYEWTPVADEVFGVIGNSYTLSISVEGETFRSSSYMGSVPVIDSITFKEDKEIGTNKKIYVGEFWATDVPGSGNTYWIKAYKNNVLLNKPSEINLAFDAGFSAGGALDGVTFITPIRQGINAIETDENDKSLSPFALGDSVNVQINSITLEAFNHLNEVVTQTDRPGGFQELFSSSLANVSTNIINIKPKGAKVVGFFNVSAVSTLGKRFDKL